jgi:hypothetical protein
MAVSTQQTYEVAPLTELQAKVSETGMLCELFVGEESSGAAAGATGTVEKLQMLDHALVPPALEEFTRQK